MIKAVKQIGVGAAAAVLMLLLQALLLNREPDGFAAARSTVAEADAAIKKALESDQSTADHKLNDAVTLDEVAQINAGIKWWSARSLADTAELYLQRRWAPANAAAADLGATMRALRRVAQGQELARAALARQPLQLRAAVFYGWAQWASITLLLVVALLGVGAARWRLGGLALEARACTVLCGLIVVLGVVGFLATISSTLGEAASEAGLRSGLARALHPLAVGLLCCYLANALSPKTSALELPPATGGGAAGGADAEGLRDAVRLGVLDATLVIVKGVEKNA